MSCCLICYRNCDNPEIYNETRKAKVKSDIKRFFKLLERYINGENRIKTNYPVELDKLVEAGLLSCQDCHNQMETFCDIYYVLEETEMILNWKMKSFEGIMEFAENNNLLERLKMLEGVEPGVDEVAQKVMEWRRMIAAKCNKKIQSSFPRLILNQCPLETTCPEMSALNIDPGQPLAIGPNPSDNSDGYLDTNLDNNDILMGSLETEAQVILEDIVDEGNRPNGTTIEKEPQATLHLNETKSANFTINEEIIADMETNFVNSKNEISYTCHKEDYDEYDPAQLLSDESSSSDSDNDLENIKEESFIWTKSEEITHEIPQSTEGETEHVSINSEMDIKIMDEVDKTGKNDIEFLVHNRLTPAKQSNGQIQKAQPNHKSTVVNGQRQYPCGMCGQIFNNNSTRSSHCRLFHKGTAQLTLPQMLQMQQQRRLVPANKIVQQSQQPPPIKQYPDKDNKTILQGHVGSEQIYPASPTAVNLSPIPTNYLGEMEIHEFGNESDIATTTSGAIAEETPQTTLDNMEVVNKRITTTNEMEAEHIHQETNSSNENRTSIRNGIADKAEEEIQQNNLTMLLSDESEMSSTESESKNHSGICRKRKAKIRSSVKAKIDQKRLNLSRKYKADSDIVEFLTFPCQIEGCREIFYSSEDLEDHKGHHGTFSCDLCLQSFDSALDLARHELSKHCNQKYKCPREGCDFKGKNNNHYVHHILVSHLKLKFTLRGRKFNCKICKSGFGRIGELRRHFPLCRIAAASTKPRVKCDVEGCTRSFKNDLVMKGHKQINHFTGTKPICQICRETFDNKKNLNYHITKKHQEDLTIPCVVKSCKKKFVSENSLAAHVFSKHKNEKDKISKLCPHCGKKFIGSHSLQEHLKIHGRTKDFICETCGKGFRHRDKLDLHKLSHSGPESWNYQCEHCAKKCMTKQKLEEHVRTHGNEKAFVCDICGAKYAHRHNLRIHVNSKHGDVASTFDKTNLTSTKGVKRKRRKMEEEEETDEDEVEEEEEEEETEEDTPNSSDLDSSN